MKPIVASVLMILAAATGCSGSPDDVAGTKQDVSSSNLSPELLALELVSDRGQLPNALTMPWDNAHSAAWRENNGGAEDGYEPLSLDPESGGAPAADRYTLFSATDKLMVRLGLPARPGLNEAYARMVVDTGFVSAGFKRSELVITGSTGNPTKAHGKTVSPIDLRFVDAQEKPLGVSGVATQIAGGVYGKMTAYVEVTLSNGAKREFNAQGVITGAPFDGKAMVIGVRSPTANITQVRLYTISEDMPADWTSNSFINQLTIIAAP